MIHRLIFVCLILLAGGCATLEDLYDSFRYRPQQSVVPLEHRPVEEPLARNVFILSATEQSVVGEPQVVFTTNNDTLSDLAREYGLGYDEIIAANPGVNPWLPGENTPILLPTQYVLPDVPREGVVLNIASKRLYYFPEPLAGQPARVMTYPIGIGRVGWETPLGEAAVIAKATDPTWYVPASVRKEHAELGNPLPSVVPPGPDNPLGHRVLKLDMPGYLIHGTNQPYGVGMRVSHGCVRLYPENIEVLYELVAIGEVVQIINEPYLLGRRDDHLFFEAHEPLEDDTVPVEERFDTLFASSGNELSRHQKQHVRAVASVASGIPVIVDRFDADEVLARARVVRNTVEVDPDNPTLIEVREMIDEAVREGREETL
ncbi:MAG: L,D-transpeptidase family protein [Woeseiaceae bacterium]|nr:L,D-transpeptidase family protein [Woeseiaceae bacterium]